MNAYTPMTAQTHRECERGGAESRGADAGALGVSGLPLAWRSALESPAPETFAAAWGGIPGVVEERSTTRSSAKSSCYTSGSER
jgi:hypothetical protein